MYPSHRKNIRKTKRKLQQKRKALLLWRNRVINIFKTTSCNILMYLQYEDAMNFVDLIPGQVNIHNSYILNLSMDCRLECLSRLTQLRQLYLGNMNLPICLNQLTQLRFLILTQVKEVNLPLIPSLHSLIISSADINLKLNLPPLKLLSLVNCKLSKDVFNVIDTMTQLVFLDLSGSYAFPIGTTSTTFLISSSFPLLTTFTSRFTPISNLKFLSGCTSLTHLNLTNCLYIDNEDIKWFPDTLLKIDISSCNKITTFTCPDKLEKLEMSNCYRLTHLDLNNTLTYVDVSDCINFSFKSNLPDSLTYLDMSMTDEPFDIHHIVTAVNLTYLNLSSMLTLTNKDLRQISQLSKLNYLNLDGIRPGTEAITLFTNKGVALLSRITTLSLQGRTGITIR